MNSSSSTVIYLNKYKYLPAQRTDPETYSGSNGAKQLQSVFENGILIGDPLCRRPRHPWVQNTHTHHLQGGVWCSDLVGDWFRLCTHFLPIFAKPNKTQSAPPGRV